jgi:uncharacterized protein YyaL (SSP411 family)
MMMRHFVTSKDTRSIFLVEKTLDMMHRGGIYDHLGGGFSRYSVDERWLVPHFEKMLYDNAILAQAYTEAWQLTKKPLYREVAEEVLDYVLREMTHPEGGFYSAEDADSEGLEGLYYLWSMDEILKELGKEEGAAFCRFYHVMQQGNFEGKNILNTPFALEEFAAREQVDPDKIKSQLDDQRRRLLEVRSTRIHPLKDDKILSSWNGLMIYALAEASRAFDQELYLQGAIKAARFIRSHLWEKQELLRRWRDGQAMFSAGLDEYSFLIRGLLSLFEANAGTEWLQWAIELSGILRDKYKEEGGAFYQTDGTDKNLILRKCQFSDGAEPSGNAVHAENLLRLYQLTSDAGYLHQAEDILKAVKDYLENYPLGYCFHVMNLIRYYDQMSPTLVIALNSKREHEVELRRCLAEKFIPHKALVWQIHDVEMEELLPYTKDLIAKNDKTTLYLCYEGVCQKPLNQIDEIVQTIDELYH